MFRVELLPAQQGDALWIEYGEPGSVHRILIDGGTPPSYQVVKDRIQALSATERHFELCIVTHVDTDHIGGALKLLADRSLGATFGDVWFNDQEVLPPCPDPRRGPIDGAILTRVLDGLGITPNRAFDGNAVCVPEQGELPVRSLAGGMRLTLLSPGHRATRGTLLQLDRGTAEGGAWPRRALGRGAQRAGPAQGGGNPAGAASRDRRGPR